MLNTPPQVKNESILDCSCVAMWWHFGSWLYAPISQIQKCPHANNIVTILYILKCGGTVNMHTSVICHVVCLHSHKSDISCSFYLPPCFMPPATTAASTWLIYNCISLLSFWRYWLLCYFCVFLASETLKKKNSAELVPCIVFSLLPLQLLALAIQLRSICILHVKGITQLSVPFQAFYDCLFFVVYFILFYFIYIFFA